MSTVIRDIMNVWESNIVWLYWLFMYGSKIKIISIELSVEFYVWILIFERIRLFKNVIIIFIVAV